MRHYAMTDIHGNGEIFDQMVAYMNAGDNDWICYFLGDACDRGPDGYHIIRHLLDDTQRFVYLKGNHEDMFVKAATALFVEATQAQLSIPLFLEAEQFDVYDLPMMADEINLHYYNGGFSTFKAWLEDDCPMLLIRQLQRLPISTSYGKYDMCHAGCRVSLWDTQDEQTFLWDRSHFLMDEEWMLGRVLLHGHTPVKNVIKHHNPNALTDEPFVYANGTKIDLDVGVARTGEAYLFDLDSEKFIYFPR